MSVQFNQKRISKTTKEKRKNRIVDETYNYPIGIIWPKFIFNRKKREKRKSILEETADVADENIFPNCSRASLR